MARKRSSRRKRCSMKGGSKCKSGQIRRKSYTRKTKSGKRVHVKSRCIKDLGASGRGKKIIPIGEHLGYGYSTKKSMKARRRSLKRAVSDKGHNKVIHALTARANLQHRTHPTVYKKMRQDINWLKTQ